MKFPGRMKAIKMVPRENEILLRFWSLFENALKQIIITNESLQMNNIFIGYFYDATNVCE